MMKKKDEEDKESTPAACQTHAAQAEAVLTKCDILKHPCARGHFSNRYDRRHWQLQGTAATLLTASTLLLQLLLLPLLLLQLLLPPGK